MREVSSTIEFKTQDLSNKGWTCRTSSVYECCIAERVASCVQVLAHGFDVQGSTSRDAFDFCFNLLSFSWSFTYAMNCWQRLQDSSNDALG